MTFSRISAAWGCYMTGGGGNPYKVDRSFGAECSVNQSAGKVQRSTKTQYPLVFRARKLSVRPRAIESGDGQVVESRDVEHDPR